MKRFNRVSTFRPYVLFTLLLSVSMPLQAGSMEDLLKRADHQFEREKYGKALKTLREARAMDASSPKVIHGLTRALYAHARDLYESGEPSGEARDLLEEMLELTDEASARMAAYKLLGSVHYRNSNLSASERLGNAEEAYRQALHLAGGNDWASRLSLAVVLRDRGMPQEAFGQLRALAVDDLEKEPRVAARSLICELKPLVAGKDTLSSAELPKKIGGQVVKPEKLFSPPPQYSDTVRRQRISGTVMLKGLIDQDGCVVDLKVLNEAPEALVSLVTGAVSRWLFDPARLDGEPVAVHYNLTTNMKLTGPRFAPPVIFAGPWP